MIILVIGESGVGKTCLINRIVNNSSLVSAISWEPTKEYKYIPYKDNITFIDSPVAQEFGGDSFDIINGILTPVTYPKCIENITPLTDQQIKDIDLCIGMIDENRRCEFVKSQFKKLRDINPSIKFSIVRNKVDCYKTSPIKGITDISLLLNQGVDKIIDTICST